MEDRFEFHEATIADLARRLRSGELSVLFLS